MNGDEDEDAEVTGDKISEMVSGAILKTLPWIANIGALSPDVYSASRRMEFSAWFQTKVLQWSKRRQ